VGCFLFERLKSTLSQARGGDLKSGIFNAGDRFKAEQYQIYNSELRERPWGALNFLAHQLEVHF